MAFGGDVELTCLQRRSLDAIHYLPPPSCQRRCVRSPRLVEETLDVRLKAGLETEIEIPR